MKGFNPNQRSRLKPSVTKKGAHGNRGILFTRSLFSKEKRSRKQQPRLYVRKLRSLLRPYPSTARRSRTPCSVTFPRFLTTSLTRPETGSSLFLQIFCRRFWVYLKPNSPELVSFQGEGRTEQVQKCRIERCPVVNRGLSFGEERDPYSQKSSSSDLTPTVLDFEVYPFLAPSLRR